jgi:hypothetical protein
MLKGLFDATLLIGAAVIVAVATVLLQKYFTKPWRVIKFTNGKGKTLWAVGRKVYFWTEYEQELYYRDLARWYTDSEEAAISKAQEKNNRGHWSRCKNEKR